MSCCVVVRRFVCVDWSGGVRECVFVHLWVLLGECSNAMFSSSPSVWLQCRVTLIPLISTRAQHGRGLG